MVNMSDQAFEEVVAKWRANGRRRPEEVIHMSEICLWFFRRPACRGREMGVSSRTAQRSIEAQDIATAISRAAAIP
jgi:hypothetical protein